MAFNTFDGSGSQETFTSTNRQYGLGQTSVETCDSEWCNALLVLQAMNDDDDKEQKELSNQHWLSDVSRS